MSLEEQIQSILLEKENMISGFRVPYIIVEIKETAEAYKNNALIEANENVNQFRIKEVDSDFEKGWNSCIDCINQSKAIIDGVEYELKLKD